MKIGPYELGAPLGHGGMGSVYRGRSPDGREVAIKVLNRLSPTSRARFDRERRLLASLGEKEGFVPLLDAGESAQGPWLAMPLLAGGTLRARLERGPLSTPEAIGLAATLTRALVAAHAHGIVHRDLKPENILFTAHGAPLIADLGLAKHFDADAPGASRSVSLSVQGESCGTAGFLAPEQMSDAKSAGPPADVFALGAILYECLAGQPAFQGSTVVEVLAMAAAGTFEPLRRVCPTAPPALAAAIERALAPDPTKRATTADLLAALEGRKLASSRRPIVALALALLAGVAAVGFVATRGVAQPHEAAPPAPAAPVAPPIVFTPEESAFQERVKKLVATKHAKIVAARGHDEMRHSLDARMLVFAKTRDGRLAVVSGGADALLRVWDFETGREVARWETGHEVRSLAASPDGRFLVVGTVKGEVSAWDMKEERRLRTVEGHEGHVAVGISADAKWGVSSGQEATVRRWPIAGEGVEAPIALNSTAWFVRFVPDDPEHALLGLESGSLGQASFSMGIVQTFQAHALNNAVTDGAFLSDGSIATVGFDHQLRRALVAEPLYAVPVHPGRQMLCAVAASPDGRRIATGGGDRRIELHDVKEGGLVAELAAGVAVNSLAFSPDGKRLAVAGSGGAIRFLDLAGKDLRPLAPETHRGNVRGLALTKDGSLLASASEDGTVKVWDVSGERIVLRATRTNHMGPVMGVGWVERPGAPRRLLSLGREDGLRLAALDGGAKEIHVATDPAATETESLAVSGDGRYAVVSNNWQCGGQLFDVTETLIDRKKLIGNLHRAAFSADSRRFVVGTAGHEGKQVVVFGSDDDSQWTFDGEPDHGWMRGEAFLDATGDKVVSTTHTGIVDAWDTKGTARLWRAETGEDAYGVAVLGARIAVLERDRIVFLDAATGEHQDTLDLRALDDVPFSCVADPPRRTLWIGTAKGAILKLRVE